MRDDNEHERLISKKSNFYKYCDVHIILKNNNGWENGKIVSVGADLIQLELSDEGQKKHNTNRLNLFFLEIEDIQQLKIKEVKA